MDLGELDRELHWWLSTVSRVSANLLWIEEHPAREMLDAGRLEGATAERWATAHDKLAGLFVAYASLKEPIDSASAQRASWTIVTEGRIERLAALLRGPSIEVVGGSVPVGERDLLGDSRIVVRRSPSEVLDTMAADFEVVKNTMVAVAAVWDELPGQLARQRERIAGLIELAATVDEPADVLTALEQHRAHLANVVLSDPLSVDSAAVPDLDRLIGAEDRRLHAMATARDDSGPQIELARSLLAEMHHALDAAAAARLDVAPLFVAASLPDEIERDGTLDDRLPELARLAERGDWRGFTAMITELNDAVVDTTERAIGLQASCASLRAERAELRGRLDALEAKAAARHVIEDQELSTVYERAHAALYTAPADLGEAHRLVQQYGALLISRAERSLQP